MDRFEGSDIEFWMFANHLLMILSCETMFLQSKTYLCLNKSISTMPENQKNKSIGFSDPNDKGASPPKGKNYLLAIGIDNYAHCPKLYNAVKDVQDLVAVLTKRFQFELPNIKTLFDQQATKRNIYAAFEYFAEKVTPADNFIIYFSGHGEYKKIFNLGYWIPVEAEQQAVDQYIPNSEVRNILSAVKSHHTFLVVDSCFSGALFSKGTGKNISLRKERDPSRWGLTAGRNEIVTDGQPGDNSPFAKSILYQLQHTEEPVGVAELCNKVLEVVAANADQTPRGEPLKVEGHQGGQFVFHLKIDEAADWQEAREKGNLAAMNAFVSRYPEGKYTDQAERTIHTIQAAELWQKIEAAPEGTNPEIGQKLQLINAYAGKYANMPHYAEALDLGEWLEYKGQFVQAKNSAFSLRKFLLIHTPDMESAAVIRQEALTLLNTMEQSAAASDQARETERQQEKAQEEQRAKEAREAQEAAARKKQAELQTEERYRQKTEQEQAVERQQEPSPEDQGAQEQNTSSFPFQRYTIVGGTVLTLLLAIWVLPEMCTSGSDVLTPSNSATGPAPTTKLIPKMVNIQGGTFTMGSPKTEAGRSEDEVQHSVTLTAFAIGKYEVTQAEWRAVMGNNPSNFKNCDECPVENVSWDDIQEFLKKLNAWHPGKRYRLPTEAEWEYAARGGHKMPKDQSMMSTYAGGNDIGEVAWYSANSGSKTHPVGKKTPNALDLYDMSGNVFEWCSDWYGEYPQAAQTNPIGPKSGLCRVLRGGNWIFDPRYCRAAQRRYLLPSYGDSDLGFRLASSSF